MRTTCGLFSGELRMHHCGRKTQHDIFKFGHLLFNPTIDFLFTEMCPRLFLLLLILTLLTITVTPTHFFFFRRCAHPYPSPPPHIPSAPYIHRGIDRKTSLVSLWMPRRVQGWGGRGDAYHGSVLLLSSLFNRLKCNI